MRTINEIEKLTKDFSDARRALSERVQTLEDEITALKRKYLPGIRRAVEATSERHESLSVAIEDSPELFVKPRTWLLHGIKVGYQKQKGKIEWEDEATVIKLIKKHFPDTWETYVKTIEKPLKAALEALSVAELKKLGVTAEETGDAVLIKSTDSEIDKLVNALLKDEETTPSLRKAAA